MKCPHCNREAERQDPPPETWPDPPEPPKGYRWEARGWGWLSRQAVTYAALWEQVGWMGPVRKSCTEGATDCFYLEAVPLDKVPFDGPEDFVCEPLWIWAGRENDDFFAVETVAREAVWFECKAFEWDFLALNEWLYSDSIKGPWHKFEKDQTS